MTTVQNARYVNEDQTVIAATINEKEASFLADPWNPSYQALLASGENVAPYLRPAPFASPSTVVTGEASSQ